VGHEDAVDTVRHHHYYAAEDSTQSLGWPICFF
jgi:hypothetical protein